MSQIPAYPLVLPTDDGKIHVVWSQDIDGNHLPEVLYHSYSFDGETWSTPVEITEGIGGWFFNFTADSDSWSRIHLVVEHRYQLFYTVYEEPAWAPFDSLFGAIGLSWPRMAIDDSGSVHLVWEDHPEGPPTGISYSKLPARSLGTVSNPVPERFRLYPNYPNPFNTQTVFSFELAERAFVSLKVFDIRGELVKTVLMNEADAGEHTIRWDGTNDERTRVSSGVYIYVLVASVNGSNKPFNQSGKMVLLR